eukprot:1143354-Pelagomonas_calceolata.AAC.4
MDDVCHNHFICQEKGECVGPLCHAAADASLEAKERDENFDRGERDTGEERKMSIHAARLSHAVAFLPPVLADDYSKRLFGLPFKQLSAEHKERVVNQMMLDERRAGGHQISEETAQAKACRGMMEPARDCFTRNARCIPER